MNPNNLKLFTVLAESSLFTARLARNNPVRPYFDYGYYLAKNWFPRLSTWQSSSDAYYPKRVQWSAYIVYFLLADLAYCEYSSTQKQRAQQKERDLALRD